MVMSSKMMKRKRVVLSLEDKLGILDRLKAGASHTKLAEEYGIGKATVGDLKKNEEKNLILCIDNCQHIALHIQLSGNLSIPLWLDN